MSSATQLATAPPAPPTANIELPKKKRLTLQSGLFLAVVAVLAFVADLRINPVSFFPFTVTEFVQLMTPLIMLALFIERAAEVFMTAGRGEGAAAIALEIRRLRLSNIANDPNIKLQIVDRQQQEVAYKAQTQRIAFLANFLLGTIVSALGIRAIGMFVDPEAFKALSDLHQRLFNTFDVVLTAALLGGGADGLHKLVSVFTSWMDKAKADTESKSQA